MIGPQLFPYVRPAHSDIRPAVAPAVENLMRKYYLVGRGVLRVTRRVLERATVPARRPPRIQKIDRSFLSWNGKLAARDPALFRREPPEMLRYFLVAQERQLPRYGHTMELIETEVAESGSELAGNELASKYFLRALVDLADTHERPLLKSMHSVGLLAAVMPEFGPCTGRVQHDLYHVYTVDYHQLYALALLKKTARGELGPEGEAAMQAYREIEGPVEPLLSGHAAARRRQALR